MAPQEVNTLLLKTFWMMSGNIDRIMAQKDMRALTIAAGTQADAEGHRQIRQQLVLETGTIVKTQPAALFEKRDESGFAQLKELAKIL